jgi:aspartyl-tRNA(Asn)/glutamyl-tRNA(Gln) amidotransferase subunit C
MATLTKKQVKHIADLSNLTLTEEEIDKFTPQLEKIIEFVKTLQEVDTEGVVPTANTTGLENVLREDEISPSEINIDEEFKVPSILTNRSSK